MSARNLLTTVQLLDAAQRRADPMRLTMAALRDAVAIQVANRSAPGPDGRYEAIIPPAQMVELHEDPAFTAALADGEAEIVSAPAAKRPRWMSWSKPERPAEPRSTVLALRPPA